MNYTYALLFGVVQGLTEFLPVSSSGHLVLTQHFFGMKEGMLTFDIFLHFGTLVAVLLVFRKSIVKLFNVSIHIARSFASGKQSLQALYRSTPEFPVIIALFVGTFPAVFAGFFMKDAVENLFSSPLPVFASLGFTGVVLISTFFSREKNFSIGPLRGLITGFAQALAIIPGISRSGLTISAALFSGARRSDAGEFSFLLSIPVIIGATVFAVTDAVGNGLGIVSWGPVCAGTLAAFLSGWLSLVLLMKIVRRGSMGYFGFYCIAVSLFGIMFVTQGISKETTTTSKETSMDSTTASIKSSYDGELQTIRFLRAKEKKRPLLVALHTWSFDYTQDSCDEYFRRCRDRDWNCIFPDFRGPNNNPLAGGSEAALQDILDAVAWAFENMSVEHRRIFLAGVSGGGHMALLSAGNSPSTWTAVSAWASISDLAQWHRESVERELHYSLDIENVCGGPPGVSNEIDREYKKRSPVTSLWRAHIIPMDINAGIHDGHAGKGGEGSVPVGHSIRAFNELAKASEKPSDIIPEDVIDYIEREERIPEGFERRVVEDPSYGRTIHLRRVSSMARLTLFEGGHEILFDAVFDWFDNF